MPGFAQLALNAATARAGLIAKLKAPAMLRQLRRQSPQRRRCVRDLAMLAQFPLLARLGKRHRDCVFVHIQADVDRAVRKRGRRVTNVARLALLPRRLPHIGNSLRALLPRHVNKRLAFTPWRSARSVTEALGTQGSRGKREWSAIQLLLHRLSYGRSSRNA